MIPTQPFLFWCLTCMHNNKSNSLLHSLVSFKSRGWFFDLLTFRWYGLALCNSLIQLGSSCGLWFILFDLFFFCKAQPLWVSLFFICFRLPLISLFFTSSLSFLFFDPFPFFSLSPAYFSLRYIIMLYFSTCKATMMGNNSDKTFQLTVKKLRRTNSRGTSCSGNGEGSLLPLKPRREHSSHSSYHLLL